MSRQCGILIVDDNPTNIAILEESLGDDYVLETAASGEEALDIAADFLPALILLDVMMPGIDGYETCRQIRSIPALRHTKIIMVSAKATVVERLQGYEAGADDYIAKPFDEEELLAKVRVYLRLKSAEEMGQLKSDLLLLLNHEIRTPLNGIMAPVQMLMEDDDMDREERTMFLDMVYQSAQRLLNLFKKVMTLSTMKSGGWEFQFIPADLGDVVRDAVATVAAQASAHNVQVDQQLSDVATTMLDREQMRGVVAAVLENAIRFSPANGLVVVGVRRDRDRFCVTVTDQGAGIDPDVLPHMFEEFVHADIAHHTEGQGLSLAIARQIVLAHKGMLSVESTTGAGTTFIIRLPITVPPDDGSQTVCVAKAL